MCCCWRKLMNLSQVSNHIETMRKRSRAIWTAEVTNLSALMPHMPNEWVFYLVPNIKMLTLSTVINLLNLTFCHILNLDNYKIRQWSTAQHPDGLNFFSSFHVVASLKTPCYHFPLRLKIAHDLWIIKRKKKKLVLRITVKLFLNYYLRENVQKTICW